MTHFVADHRADGPVVHRVVCVEVEKGILQNSGGEHDLVAHGVVVRVHCLRRHAPLFGIDRFADFGELVLALGNERAREVTDQIVLHDRDA
jgi:hypothetical protein